MTQGAIWVVLSRAGSGDGRVGRSAGFALAAGLAIGGVLLLTGCGGSPPAPQQTFAEFTPPASPSPSTPPSTPSAAAPVRPVEMDRTDEVGATAAAAYFMQLFSYAVHTGDVQEWNRVSAEACEFCALTRTRVERVYGAGGMILGSDMTFEPAEFRAHDATIGAYGVAVPFAVTSGSENDAEGQLLQTIEPESGEIILDVIYSSAGWTLVGGSMDESAAQ